MDNYTNEKSLVVVQNNFLTKIKKFLSNFFWSKNIEDEIVENEKQELSNENVETIKENEPEEKERKLYNFDADDNDEWPGDENMKDDSEKNMDDKQNEENENKDNEIEYEKEQYSEAYREKQELEQKLLNYYESIKKGI